MLSLFRHLTRVGSAYRSSSKRTSVAKSLLHDYQILEPRCMLASSYEVYTPNWVAGLEELRAEHPDWVIGFGERQQKDCFNDHLQSPGLIGISKPGETSKAYPFVWSETDGYRILEYFDTKSSRQPWFNYITNRGEVLGSYAGDTYDEPKGILYWDTDGQVHDLTQEVPPPIAHATNAPYFLSYNDHGEFLIAANADLGSKRWWHWNSGSGVWTELPRSITIDGYRWTLTPSSINNSGEIVGSGITGTWDGQAGRGFILKDGNVSFLPGGGVVHDFVGAIQNTDNGDVAGWRSLYEPDAEPFLWNGNEQIRMHDLKFDSTPYDNVINQPWDSFDINNDRTAVSSTRFDPPPTDGGWKFFPPAGIWDELNGTRMLSDLVPEDYADENFCFPVIICDDGTIVVRIEESRIELRTVFLKPVNEPPTLDPIDDIFLFGNMNQRSVDLTGISAGKSDFQPLRITAESDKPSIIPHPTIHYQSPNSTGTLLIFPIANQDGTVNISVTVEDGGNDNDLRTVGDNLTSTETFTVTFVEAHDLGLIEYIGLSSINVEGDAWFYGSAKRDGVLTGQALASSAGSLDIELYDANLDLIAFGSPLENGTRFDSEVLGGQDYYIRLVGDEADVELTAVNLVTKSGSRVDVWGTASADSFTFAAAANHRLVIKDIEYRFDSEEYDEFLFDGGTATDTFWLGGTSSGEAISIRRNQLTMIGNDYTVEAKKFETMTFVGRGGNDTADFYDTIASEIFTSHPSWSKLEGYGFYHMVRGVPAVTARATFGYDVVFMRDSAGDDTYETFSDRVVMTSDTHVATAIGWKRSSGTSTGGNDTATAHDSAGNDRLLSYDDRIILFDGTHTHTSIDFTINQVFASGQVGDVAYMFDSAGDDQMVARPGSTVITQSDRQTTAQGFAQSFAYASTGNDTAEFYDTSGNNDYNGYLDRAVMKGDGIFLWGRGFDQMTGHFSGGTDRALMFDSEGDDTYVSGASDTTMSNSSASNRIVGYSSIYAYSNGGSDTAALYDTGGEETFRAYPDKAVLHGDDMFSWTRGFSQVTAHSSGGTDEAQLYDSASDDTFRSEGATAQMSGGGWYLNMAQGFLKNSGFSRNGGVDTALMFDTSGDDLYRTYPTEVFMIGSGVTNAAYGFGQTQGFSNTGTDSARLFDSAGDDLLMSYADRATLSGDGWANEVVGFDRNTVYGSSGYDQATMEDSTGDDLVKVRANGPKLTQGDGTVFDVRTFDRILARSVNGGEDIAELLDVDYEFELEGDWNS